MNRFGRLSGRLLGAALLLSGAAAADDAVVHSESNVSMDFYGYLDGLEVGDRIAAYDPDGVLSGEWVVDKPGQWGFMAVYGDDTTTPAVDEGAEPGDVLRFELNGAPLATASGEPVVWLGNNEKQEVGFAPIVIYAGAGPDSCGGRGLSRQR